MDGRTVVLKPLRGKVVCCLHSPSQGWHESMVGMKAWLSHTNDIYWLGMNASICNFGANCFVFAHIAPFNYMNWS